MRRTAVAAALVLFVIGGTPAFRAFAPAASAQDKDKEKKDAERKKQEEEEERKKREKARLEKVINAIAAGFAAKSVDEVLLNVPDKEEAVELRLDDGKAKSFSRVQARGALQAFFDGWKVIRVDTSSTSVDQNAASIPLSLFKTSAEDPRQGKRLRVKVGSAEDKYPLVKLVVER